MRPPPRGACMCEPQHGREGGSAAKSSRCFTSSAQLAHPQRVLLRRVVLVGSPWPQRPCPVRRPGPRPSARGPGLRHDQRRPLGPLPSSPLGAPRRSPLALAIHVAARGLEPQRCRRSGSGTRRRIPYEVNGAPDDGFAVAAWCENVTYSMAAPELGGRRTASTTRGTARARTAGA